MRIILIALGLIGLMMLLLSFFWDVFTQSQQTELGTLDYYLPALLTITFIIWTLITIGRRKIREGENKYLKVIIIGLLTYAIIWQLIYLKFILTKNFAGGLTDYLTESFPILVALSCSCVLIIMKFKELKIQLQKRHNL